MENIIKQIKRWQQSEAQQTLRKCGLHEGMDVLDFGCGGLHWTLPAVYSIGIEGKVYAIDYDKNVIAYANTVREEQKIPNLLPVRLRDDQMNQLDIKVDFIMYYDIFHGLGAKISHELPAMERKKLANVSLMHEFNRILKSDGLLTVAVFSEVGMVQDTVNGPFTPKGAPKWLTVDYEKGLELYNVIPLITECGFELIKTVNNEAIHFDEIEKHLNNSAKANQSIDDLEKRDIWVFRKVREN